MSFISLFILKARLCLLCRVQLFPLAVHCFIFIIFFSPSTEFLHCFAVHLHFIFTINGHKGKWVLWFEEYNDTICSSCRVPFVQPCATFYCYLTLNERQEICSVCISNYFELHIDRKFTKRGVIYLFQSRLIHISSKGKSDTSVISSLLFRFF